MIFLIGMGFMVAALIYGGHHPHGFWRAFTLAAVGAVLLIVSRLTGEDD
jgi:hypothetical protein